MVIWGMVVGFLDAVFQQSTFKLRLDDIKTPVVRLRNQIASSNGQNATRVQRSMLVYFRRKIGRFFQKYGRVSPIRSLLSLWGFWSHGPFYHQILP